MKKLYFLIAILPMVLIFSLNLKAQELSLRNCMLLPITDGLDGSIGFKVFERIEDYLKESTWCTYKNNSDIINILGNYKRNLQLHLQNHEVLKLIATKVEAGTMMKIKLYNQIKGIGISMEIIGSNGKDIYFKDKTHLTNDSVAVISRTIINWLEVYEKTIPYDGKVLTVVGNQFTVDIGKKSLVNIGNVITVKRPIAKKEHPLLKEIVEWESELLGKGEIFGVSDSQASGVIKNYYSNNRIKKGDWVRIDKDEDKSKVNELQFPTVREHEFGKLGVIDLNLILGRGSISSYIGSTDRKVSGWNVGFLARGEFWGTRNLFAKAAIGRTFGAYEPDNARTANDNNVSKGYYQIAGGYRFLPLGFFYGPQIDVYGGWAMHSINAEANAAEGFGEWSIHGLFMGARADAPIYRHFRLYLRFDLIPFGAYNEETLIYGTEDSAMSFDLEFGTTYMYSPKLTFKSGFNLINNKTTFNGTNAEVQSSDLNFKLSAIFAY